MTTPEDDALRAANVEKFGPNCAKEREVCTSIVAAWTRSVVAMIATPEGWVAPGHVLQDFTRADIALHSPSRDLAMHCPCTLLVTNSFSGLQVKTASAGTKESGGRTSIFDSVLGYEGLGLVCVRTDTRAWFLLDGSAVDRHNVECLSLTAGARNVGKLVIASGVGLDDIRSTKKGA